MFKQQPQNFIIPVKTHKLAVYLTAHQTATISSLKEDTLGALQCGVLDVTNPHADLRMDVDEELEWLVPKVSSVDEFELAKAIKEKGRPTGRYETLDEFATLKSVLVNWETVFVQFKNSAGHLLPVKVTQPPILDEEDEQEMSEVRKGKRKAPAAD